MTVKAGRIWIFAVALAFVTSVQGAALSAIAADAPPLPEIGTSENNFVGSNLSVQTSPGNPGNLGLPPPDELALDNADPALLPQDDGINYVYERACTAGAEDALNPATCPVMNARCDAEQGGIVVNWIEVNSNVEPATETPTGRSSCMYPNQPPEPPVEGEVAAEDLPVVLTLEEFQKQPVLAATIVSQPSNFGLRNAHSNVFAQAVEQEFTFEFQDATIVLKARPVSFVWGYGDGSSTTTSTPGGPVPEGALDTQTATSHQWLETGDYEVTLTTFFAGDYSVDGGSFQPVAGEAAVVSEPHLMSIWRTEGHSVSENCIENPTGIGCQPPTR